MESVDAAREGEADGTVWESLETVVREKEVLERELRKRARKRGSRLFDVGANDGMGTLRQRPVNRTYFCFCP